MNRLVAMASVLVLLAIACSSPPPPSSASSAKPTPSTNLSMDTLACRLPVAGGWITFPGGKFTADPASSRSFDRAAGAWVPVEYENVAPDGASYVIYNDQSTEVPYAFYLVDAKTGKRRQILPAPEPPTPEPPGSSMWQVVSFANEGIYLWVPSAGMAKAVPGLWLLDPQAGKVRLVNGSYYWRMVAGGSAWALESWSDPVNSSWPEARNGGYKVYRLDLGSGQVSTWYETKTPIRLISPTADGGLLIDYGSYDLSRLALVTGPGSFAPLELPPDFPVVSSARLARPGVWLNLVGGIALYTKGEGVRIMARSTDSSLYSAAGGCG